MTHNKDSHLRCNAKIEELADQAIDLGVKEPADLQKYISSKTKRRMVVESKLFDALDGDLQPSDDGLDDLLKELTDSEAGGA